MLYNSGMKMQVFPISDNLEYYLNNPNLIKVKNLHNLANVFTVGQKINKLSVICPMTYKDREMRYSSGILWVCECECGMYYLVKSSKLKKERPQSCPSCDEHRIVDENYKIRFSGKGEDYYIKKYTEVFYKYYSPYMELEDFQQELWYWFVYCENKYGNKFYHLGHYLQTNLNKIKATNAFKVLYKQEELTQDIQYDPLTVLEDQLDSKNLVSTCFDYLDTINPRSKDIIIKRFGFNSGNIKTLDSIGKEYGLTRERVRQIELKTIDKIKIYLNKHYGDI